MSSDIIIKMDEEKLKKYCCEFKKILEEKCKDSKVLILEVLSKKRVLEFEKELNKLKLDIGNIVRSISDSYKDETYFKKIDLELNNSKDFSYNVDDFTHINSEIISIELSKMNYTKNKDEFIQVICEMIDESLKLNKDKFPIFAAILLQRKDDKKKDFPPKEIILVNNNRIIQKIAA